MDITSGDLMFSCKIDKYSQVEILDDLQQLNYVVDELMLNIMASDKTIRSPPVPGTTADSDNGILDLIKKLSAGNARDFVVEILLRESIYASLHANFFEGEYFFGLGSDCLRRYLDSMMATHIASGKSL